jgi:hypothetical protein
MPTNTISSELQITNILDAALRALKQSLIPLQAFTTVYRDVPLLGTDKVAVPFHPLESAASADFNGTYAIANSTTNVREITVNKRKYQSMGFTSSELARQPQLNLTEIGMKKGFKLAEDVIKDVLSVITNANFGSAVHTGAAGNFDISDVIDIRQACDLAYWPQTNRSLFIDAAYDANLLKQTNITKALEFGGSEAIRQGRIPQLVGFNYFPSTLIPANGENLKGFAVTDNAILVAFSPVPPAGAVANVVNYQSVTDPETGLTVEYRSWADADTDSTKDVIEVNYGYARGDAAAIKRIVSA